MTDEIGKILNSYHSKTLGKMAQVAGLDVMTGRKLMRKPDLFPKIRAEFFTEARIRASWEQLSERERAVLNRLLLRGEPVATKTFRREIVRAKLSTAAPEPEESEQPYYSYRSGAPYDRGKYAGKPTRAGSLIFEDVIARLTYRGLVFSTGAGLTSGKTPRKIQFHPAATLYVPDVVQRCLPEPEPIPANLAAWKPDRVESGMPMLLLRDLYLYWDFVRRNDVSLLQSGAVGKRWLKAINAILLTPDPLLKDARNEGETGRLYLLRQLLEMCELVSRYRGALRVVDSGRKKDALHIQEFWNKTLTEQLGECIRIWSQLRDKEKLEGNADRFNPHTNHARQAVLGALATSSPDMWLEVEEILDQIQSQNVNFLFASHSKIESGNYYSYSFGFRRKNTKALLQELEKFEAEFVRNCLTGFLHQAGAVELGYEGNSLQGVRLTPEGQVMLGIKPEKQATQQKQDEAGKLIVQPNFQLLALGPVSLALLAQLDLFADRERADLGAFEYRLSRESVYQAQQLGIDVADVLRFLKQHSEAELPQNVRRSLEEWNASHERIVFRTGVSLLQAADADLLAALTDDSRTGKHLARPVSADVSLIKNGRQKQLISALVERELFPAVSGAQPEAADHSIIAEQDGSIRSIHAVPSLHLRGRLSRLAEETDDGGWALTSTSVRRAGGSKPKVLRLLGELTKLHRGTVPPTLTEQIKAWGGYYGRAAAETLTLIEFRDQATMEELINHPDLKAYLTPFPAQGRALAIVPAKNLAQVKKILARFGVRVTDGLR